MDASYEVQAGGVGIFDCARCRVRFDAWLARITAARLDRSTDPAGVLCRVCAGEVSEADAAAAPALRG